MYPTLTSYIQVYNNSHPAMEILAAMQPYLIVLPKTSLRQDNYMIPSHMTCKKPNLKNESNDSYSSKNGPFTSPYKCKFWSISYPQWGPSRTLPALPLSGYHQTMDPLNSKIIQKTLSASPLKWWKKQYPSNQWELQKPLSTFIFINDDDEAWELPDAKLQPYNISSFYGRITFQWYVRVETTVVICFSHELMGA